MISEEVLQRRVFKQSVNDRLVSETIMGMLDAYVDKEKCAIDVGAAAGHFTDYFARRAKWVYAFEPSPSVAELKKKGREFDNVTVIRSAVADFNGEAEFYVDNKRLSNSGFQDLVGGPSVMTDTIKLDSFITSDAVGFIKIDVEGTELDVLKGAAGMLMHHKPNLLVEIYDPYSKYPLDHIFRYLMPWYRCYYYDHPDLVECYTVESGVQAVKMKHAVHDGDFLFVA